MGTMARNSLIKFIKPKEGSAQRISFLLECWFSSPGEWVET